MRDVAPLLQPRIVAVIGASATRQTQGNGVIHNLRLAGFAGRIVPVHPSAATVDGLDAVPGIEHLPPGVDTAVVAIPAPAVAGALPALERADVRSAVVFSNGFLPAAEAAFRAIAAASTMAIHGPNCMGLINITDGVRLYPSTVTAKVVPGRVALIAQSGSAAISLMNSTSVGLSKIITMGSEWQVTAPDYLAWLAQDAATDVIGVVLESIQRPADFATAAAAVRAAGKSLVVLKVGRSDVGAAAVQAHTGAMVSRAEAYDCFFARHGIATARDYDELIASVECLAGCRTRPAGGRIAIIGISGGETALACDMASESGLELARWSDATEAAIITALPGAAGVNPLDLGATPHHTVAQDDAAIAAILADAAVDQVMVVQDAQHTLTPTMLGNYTPRILSYGRHATRAGKPLVMVSPTAENTHSDIVAMMSESGIPVLRGLRPAMAALRNLALPPPSPALPAPQGREVAIPHNAGPLPTAETHRILAAYDIPLVRSALVNTAEQAIAASHSIGYPLAAKIASPDAPHRSEFGGRNARHRRRGRPAGRAGPDAPPPPGCHPRSPHRRVRVAGRPGRLGRGRRRLRRGPAVRGPGHGRHRRRPGRTGRGPRRRPRPVPAAPRRRTDRPHPPRPPPVRLSRPAAANPHRCAGGPARPLVGTGRRPSRPADGMRPEPDHAPARHRRRPRRRRLADRRMRILR